MSSHLIAVIYGRNNPELAAVIIEVLPEKLIRSDQIVSIVRENN
jgi:hypothetical protein